MRGALEGMAGVSDVEVEAGKADVKVAFDPAKTSVEQLLAGMKAAGQSAKSK